MRITFIMYPVFILFSTFSYVTCHVKCFQVVVVKNIFIEKWFYDLRVYRQNTITYVNKRMYEWYLMLLRPALGFLVCYCCGKTMLQIEEATREQVCIVRLTVHGMLLNVVLVHLFVLYSIALVWLHMHVYLHFVLKGHMEEKNTHLGFMYLWKMNSMDAL